MPTVALIDVRVKDEASPRHLQGMCDLNPCFEARKDRSLESASRRTPNADPDAGCDTELIKLSPPGAALSARD